MYSPSLGQKTISSRFFITAASSLSWNSSSSVSRSESRSSKSPPMESQPGWGASLDGVFSGTAKPGEVLRSFGFLSALTGTLLSPTTPAPRDQVSREVQGAIAQGFPDEPQPLVRRARLRDEPSARAH